MREQQVPSASFAALKASHSSISGALPNRSNLICADTSNAWRRFLYKKVAEAIMTQGSNQWPDM